MAHLSQSFQRRISSADRPFVIMFAEDGADEADDGLPNMESMPAVRWRQQNLDKLDESQRDALVDDLKKTLWP